MNNTSLMIRLLRRLKVEMNGAVTDAMRERGIGYPLNYGVSVPTIQDISTEYAPNHSLAQLLFLQDVRELQLASVYIDDPKLVTMDQMRVWSERFVNTEIIEQCVCHLFSSAKDAPLVANEWIASENVMVAYAGLQLAAHWITKTKKTFLDHSSFYSPVSQTCSTINLSHSLGSCRAPELLCESGTRSLEYGLIIYFLATLVSRLHKTETEVIPMIDPLIIRGSVLLLCKIAAIPEMQSNAANSISQLMKSETTQLKYIAAEVTAFYPDII